MSGMDMSNMLKQMQNMQSEMARVQQDLKDQVQEGRSGGGAVKAWVNGQGDVQGLKIDPEVLDPDDIEMLEDLIVSAVQEAINKSRDTQKKAMGQVTGGLNLPGMEHLM